MAECMKLEKAVKFRRAISRLNYQAGPRRSGFPCATPWRGGELEQNKCGDELNAAAASSRSRSGDCDKGRGTLVLPEFATWDQKIN